MRELTLDIETTGLSPTEDSIIEIACVEINSLLPTGRFFHSYVETKRKISREAFNIHASYGILLS